MIPRRVLHPPIKSLPNNEKRPRRVQTDWDSPSSYTGTVKRRPKSFESAKFLTPINDYVDNDIIETKYNCKILPQDATIDTIKINGKNNEPSIQDFHINKNNKSKSLPISTTLKRRSNLKQLTTNNSSKLVSSSSLSPSTPSLLFEELESNGHVVKTRNIIKFTTPLLPPSTIKFQNSSAIPNPQVEKLKENSTLSKFKTISSNKNAEIVSIDTRKIPNKQKIDYKRKFTASNKFTKDIQRSDIICIQTPPTTSITRLPPPSNSITTNTQNKHVQKTLPTLQENKSSFEKSTSIATYKELYRDFPVNYASTTIVESIPLNPPPYCNPPSVVVPSNVAAPSTSSSLSQVVLFKQNKNLIETHKKIRLKNENKNESTQHENPNKHLQSKHAKIQFSYGNDDGNDDGFCSNSIIEKNSIVCGERINSDNKLSNDFRLSLKGNLEKIQNISKLTCGYNRQNRFFPTANNKFTSVCVKDKKHITSNSSRVNSNDYVLFNPKTKQNSNTTTTTTNMAEAIMVSPDKNDIPSMTTTSCDILAKPKFSSNVFANIPVRPRKGIPHLENYCLFDPSTDFMNEKEIRQRTTTNEEPNLPNFDVSVDNEAHTIIDDDELIEEIIYEDQLTYDVSSDENDFVAYFPKIDEVDREASTSSSSQIDSSSGSDLMMNSVIETSSTNMESNDDENDIKKKQIRNISQHHIAIRKSISGSLKTNSIHQQHQISGSVTTTTTALKKPMRIDKCIRQSSLPSNNLSTSNGIHRKSIIFDDSSKINDFSQNVENENKVNFSPSSTIMLDDVLLKQQYKDTLKQSVSSPQLQQISLIFSKSSSNGNKILPSSPLTFMESNYVLFHPAPVHSRIPYRIRQPRPLSTHSDADSGFLSPVTPDGSADGKFNPALLVLQQCDSIQGYIEVS